MTKSNPIPDSAMLTVEEYLTEREMSSIPILLVEGTDDGIFFELARDEILHLAKQRNDNSYALLSDLEIETPELIKSPVNSILGNREKVEYVCSFAERIGFNGLFSGFVDREFRGFELNDEIIDVIKCHHNRGVLFWSRGHSIENYLFDFKYLREGLRNYSISSYFSSQNALELFEKNFSIVIKISASLSLAALNCGLIDFVSTSLSYEYISFDETGEIQINIDKWRSFLTKNKKIDVGRCESLIEEFVASLSLVSSSDGETLRWLCHGHIGINFIWAAFEACLNYIWTAENTDIKRRKIRKTTPVDRFVQYCSSWMKRNIDNENKDTPTYCIYSLCCSK